MAKVIAVCKSDRKGVSKTPVPSGILRADHGLVGDAHAAPEDTKRQVSLLAQESIKKMNAQGYDFKPGDFAENITTDGIILASLPLATRLKIGETVVIEITQIGKKCHTGCAIFQQVGTCIMPKEGVFARVVKGGPISPGDEIRQLN